MPVVAAQAELLKPDADRQPNTSVDPVPKEVTPEPDAELSPKFAALARKERALRSQAQALKAREDALKAQESDYSTKYVPKDRLTKETMAVLTENGISYEQLTNELLNQPGPQDRALSALKSEIEDLRSQLKQQASSVEENQKKAYEQAVSQIRNEAKLLIDSDAAFETIKGTDNLEAVVELIKETYRTDNIVLSVKDAAAEVEDYLIEEAMKMAQLPKVKGRLTPPPVEDQKPQVYAKQQLKTLTNSVSESSTKPTSDRDRRERAIAAFKGQLK